MTRRPTASRSELSKARTRPQKPPAPAPQHPDLEHVPTVDELFARGLAIPHGNAYRLEPEGQALIYDTMRRNADRMKADPDLRRRVERWAIVPNRETLTP